MENEQIQEFCQEGLKISELKGVQNGLSFLIGEKFRRTFLQLKKAREKLQFLYPSEDESENHPLNKGGRALKMSYALAIQEHYSTPLEQVKHFELFLKTDDSSSSSSGKLIFQSLSQLLWVSSGSRSSWSSTHALTSCWFVEQSRTKFFIRNTSTSIGVIK